MAKMTREEKRQAAVLEREKQDAMEFAAAVAAEREKLVVADDRDFAAMQEVGRRSGNEQLAYALYAALAEVRRLRESFAQKTEWLGDKVREMERALAENRFYSSTVFQNVADAQQTYGQFYEALQHAARLANALKVHAPMLHAADDLAKREKLLALEVVLKLDDGKWHVRLNGEPATSGSSAEPLPGYDEEWLAWRAARTLVHGR